MDLTYHEDRGVTVVKIAGDLDAAGGGELGQVFDRLLTENHRRFVIDLKAVEFIDSAGLSMLVRCFKRVRSGAGALWLAALQPPVRRVFEITRLDRAFDIDRDVHAALQRLTGG
jgi:anti-sigma B factor antagonist